MRGEEKQKKAVAMSNARDEDICKEKNNVQNEAGPRGTKILIDETNI